MKVETEYKMILRDDAGRYLGTINDPDTARLAAAAPDMLEALRGAGELLISCAARMPNSATQVVAKIGAAIAKAEGR